MTSRRRAGLGVCFVGVGLLIGCGSSIPGQLQTDASSNDRADARAAITVSAKVIDIAGGAPIPGASVCILDHPEIACATTDAAGAYTIALPEIGAGLDIAANVTAAGFLGDTGLVHEGEQQSGAVGVAWFSTNLRADAAAVDLLSTHAGFTYPAAGKGFVLLSVFHQGGGAFAGQTVALSPASGSGPVYADPSGNPDPSLSAITSNGYALFGGLTPGKIEITATGATCTPVSTVGGMWTSTTPHTIAGAVAADSITRMSITCAE